MTARDVPAEHGREAPHPRATGTAATRSTVSPQVKIRVGANAPGMANHTRLNGARQQWRSGLHMNLYCVCRARPTLVIDGGGAAPGSRSPRLGIGDGRHQPPGRGQVVRSPASARSVRPGMCCLDEAAVTRRWRSSRPLRPPMYTRLGSVHLLARPRWPPVATPNPPAPALLGSPTAGPLIASVARS